jgi:hypothetical protein
LGVASAFGGFYHHPTRRVEQAAAIYGSMCIFQVQVTKPIAFRSWVMTAEPG